MNTARRGSAARSRLSAEAGRRLAAGLATLCWVSPVGAQDPLPGPRADAPVVAAIPHQPSTQKAAPKEDWGFRWEEHPTAESRAWHVDRLPRTSAGRPPELRGRDRRSVRLRRRAPPRGRRGPDCQRGRLSDRVRILVRRALAGRVHRIPAVPCAPSAGRKVQAALQPRGEHQLDQSGLRLPIAPRQPPRARPRSRRDGARPRAERASVRGGTLRSRREERPNEQSGTCVRRTRPPPDA